MRDFIESILAEDLGRGDIFSAIFKGENKITKAQILAKQDGIFSGVTYATKMCEMHNIKIDSSLQDGSEFRIKDVLLKLEGGYLELLKIERSLLNVLQHSSGIATLTREFVNKMQGSKSILLDTRKTRPLLRDFEKYSVRNGGACNHRFGLDSMLMLKDNHLTHISDLSAFISQAKKQIPFGVAIEVEAQNLEVFKSALKAKADIIMCDNMKIDDIKKALELRDKINSGALVEISGNVTLQNITDYANLGADAISCGSIIHQAKWIDMSMKMAQ